jgi:hypothetical protein
MRVNDRTELGRYARSRVPRNEQVERQSQYLGVYWDKFQGLWSAKIYSRGGMTFEGYFTDELEAARAYDHRAKQLFKGGARQNFPR